MSADNINNQVIVDNAVCNIDYMTLISNLTYEFTFEGNNFPTEEYSTTNFETKYCHALKCNVRPFYLGTEIYYCNETTHQYDGKKCLHKHLLHRFILLTDLKRDYVIDEKITALFKEYLVQAAFLEWK
jgi:hypothetical protein